MMCVIDDLKRLSHAILGNFIRDQMVIEGTNVSQ